MSERDVTFRNVTVTRALGIDHGDGFELADLSEGVNLIHGPNGSGKTTTARVLQALLWPGRTDLPRPTARGEYTEGDVRWRVELDAGAVYATRDGQPGQVPDFGPAAEGRRYRLALHELLVDDDRTFAETIVTASQGGYDLAEAGDNLRTYAGPAPRTLRKKLQDADEAVAEARRTQQQLHAEARELDTLRRRQDEARQASRRLQLLESAMEYRRAADDCEDLQRQIDDLPAPVSRLTGNEREQLDRIDQAERTQQDARREMERLIAEAETTLAEVDLPEEGLGESAEHRLSAARRQLEPLRSELSAAVREVERAIAQAERARRRLGETLGDDQLAALETVELDAANELARQAHRITAREEALRQWRALLDEPTPEELAGIEPPQLHAAIHALSRWLQSPGGLVDAAPPWPAWASAALAAVLTVVLAAIVHPLWLIALIPSGGLAWIAHWRRSCDQPRDDRETYRRDFEKTRLTPPASWQVDDVADRLEQLQGLSARLAAHSKHEERRKVLAAEEEELDARRTQYHHRREALRESLGIDWPTGDEWLPVLAGNLATWQRATEEADSNSQTRDRLTRERDELIEEIGAIVAPLGCDRPTSPEHAGEIVDDLLARNQQRRDACRQRDEARRRIDSEIDPELQRLTRQRSELFERLDVDESAESELDDWLAHLPRLRELRDALTGQQAVRDRAARALEDDRELLELDEPTLQQRIERQQELADRLEELLSRITEIETRIAHAKRGHDLTDALSVRDEIAAELAATRDAKLAEAAGDALIDWVRTEAVERARPEVYRRAQRILAEITSGGLELEIDDAADPPRFRARSFGDPPRSIEELSVGERVQLLMAVRLAFVEHKETAALPLILDEALGTTDDARASAIIDSLIAIARGGRQVFYFTAQHDEVGKWLARLGEAGVDHREIDLAERRDLAAVARRPMRAEQFDSRELPAPGDQSHEAYGRSLNVPGIDPSRPAWDVHLWHVVDRPTTLHELLSAGVRTCGQLRTMLEAGATLGAGSADGLDAADRRARVIERACALWTQGRGRPVDRAALEDSGAVSETFIDEVTELARRLGGEANDFLNALADGQIARWRSSNTDKLREYFLEEGYLDDETVLEPGGIIARLMGEFAEDVEADTIERTWLRAMVESLFTGPGGEA